MIKVTLVNVNGEPVKEDASIPPFLENPAVLFWGSRVFKFKSVNLQTGALTYSEVFCYSVI
jgi:hypothetical protein